MEPPRFPQPFLESLQDFAPWADVLALVSVDKREAMGRHWFIISQCAFRLNGRRDDDIATLTIRFPGCTVDYKAGPRSRWPAIPPARCDLRLTLSGPWDDALCGLNLPANVTYLSIDCRCVSQVDAIQWPPRLASLHLTNVGARRLKLVKLPESLLHIKFDDSFDSSLSSIVWPRRLRSAAFGDSFAHAIDSVIWPAGLESLKFGRSFSRPLVNLPHGLRRLRLKSPAAVASIARASWPARLEKLELNLKLPSGVTIPAGVTVVVLQAKIPLINAWRGKIPVLVMPGF